MLVNNTYCLNLRIEIVVSLKFDPKLTGTLYDTEDLPKASGAEVYLSECEKHIETLFDELVSRITV